MSFCKVFFCKIAPFAYILCLYLVVFAQSVSMTLNDTFCNNCHFHDKSFGGVENNDYLCMQYNK